jgi:proteasome lid subunit RPN8/RPN11
MIVISPGQKNEVIKHAKDSLPHEACGILAGKDGKVEKLYQMTNISDSPETYYFMDPREQFKVMKEIRNLGWEMLAIYHSHTGSEPYPSARDVELALYPEAVYIVISLRNMNLPEIKAFKILDGKITEVELVEGGNS